MEIKRVCFFGYAESKETDPEYVDTYESARLLAEEGYDIVNGGGPGVMRAASLGAKAGGGQAIGVTFYPTEEDHMIKFEGRDKLNPLDQEIKTSSYLERTLKLIELGDVFVVMPGGSGTVSEFGMAWGLARLHFDHHDPLVLYGSFWHAIMESFAAGMRIRDEELEVYSIVDSPAEVLEKVRSLNRN